MFRVLSYCVRSGGGDGFPHCGLQFPDSEGANPDNDACTVWQRTGDHRACTGDHRACTGNQQTCTE